MSGGCDGGVEYGTTKCTECGQSYETTMWLIAHSRNDLKCYECESRHQEFFQAGIDKSIRSAVAKLTQSELKALELMCCRTRNFLHQFIK